VFTVADGSLPGLSTMSGGNLFPYREANGTYLHVRRCLPQEL